MDWQIRIALVIVGLVLIVYIYYDFSKKRKHQKENQKENQKLKRQFSNLGEQVDSAGFDLNGVSSPRPVNEKASKEVSQEPFLADKQEKISEQVTERAINVPSPKKADLFESETNYKEITSAPELVFSLILQASDGQNYKGKDFLPIFLSQGLRHGDMGIFHRHKNSGANPGPVLFSLANAISPGTFSINNLEIFETPAFALFMTLPGPGDAQVAYDAMVKTIKLLKAELGGEILDENKAKYSKQTHNNRLDAIQEYMRQLN